MDIGKKSKEENPDFWNIKNHTIIVDNTIGTRGFERVADLKCTYADLVHLFGEPMRFINTDRRVQWGFRELETDIGATIYDDNSGIHHIKDRPLDEIFTWEIGGEQNDKGKLEDRSLQIIAQMFVQKSNEGTNFISKPLDNGQETI